MAKKKVSPEISAYMSQISGRGKGGKQRAKNLTAEERSAIAKKASVARWGKAQRQDAPAKDQGDPLMPATKKKQTVAPTKQAPESLKVHGDKLDTKSGKRK